MLQAQDEFSRWFVDQVREIHGTDPDQVDVAALLPQPPAVAATSQRWTW